MLYSLNTPLKEPINKPPLPLILLGYCIHLTTIKLIPHPISRQDQILIPLQSFVVANKRSIIDVWSSKEWNVRKVVLWIFHVEITK